MTIFTKNMLRRHFRAAVAATALAAIGAAALAEDTPTAQTSHIEDVTDAQQRNFSFKHHGRSASELAAWRAVKEGMATATPNLVDLDPYTFGPELQKQLDDSTVISISSMSFGDTPLPDAATLDAYWAKNQALVVIPAGNDGNTVANIDYEPGTIAYERYSAYLRGDTVIRVGAIKGGAVASYTSENNPDFLFTNGYDEGFCSLYYMNEAEMKALREKLPQSVIDSFEVQKKVVGDLLRAHPDAATPVCNMNGTSFVTPNLAGYLLAQAHHKPAFSTYDLTVTALLAASHQPFFVGKSHKNAAGFQFNAVAGLGVFDIPRHKALMAHLEQERRLRNETGPAQALRVEGMGKPGALNAALNDNICISDTNVEVTLAARPKDAKLALPTEAVLTSPAGTRVTLKLKRDRWRGSEDGRYRLGADVSYFLGERTGGQWTLTFNPPAKGDTPHSAYSVEKLAVAHWGAHCDSALGRTMKFSAS